MQIIKSNQRHTADMGWLQTHWHFSFADYHDPANMHFGPLRVFNDDVIQGGGGFEEHPHRDMEIITYVISGELQHRDHLGNDGIIHPGEVQVMSAGKGIVHAEFNASKTQPVHLLQLWILPRSKGLPPRWEQKQFARAAQQNRLLPVVSVDGKDGTLAIDQDATIYVGAIEAGKKITHTPAAGRKIYLFVIDGEIDINGHPMAAGDQARITNAPPILVAARTAAQLLMIDLP